MRRAALLCAAACLALVAGCGSSGGSTSAGAAGKVDRAATGTAAGTGAGKRALAPSGESGAPAGPSGGSGNQDAARGTTAASPGRAVTVTDAAGTALVEVTVTSVTGDYRCAGGAAKPVNGHFLGIDLTVAALPGLAQFDNPYGDFTLPNNGVFTVVGADGVTETGTTLTPEALACSPDGNQLYYQALAPGQTYRGVLVLDVRNSTGTLRWQPVLDPGHPGPGWAWTF